VFGQSQSRSIDFRKAPGQSYSYKQQLTVQTTTKMAVTRRSTRQTATSAPKYNDESSASETSAPKRKATKPTRRKRARDDDNEDEDEDSKPSASVT
jgi:hypothetical protein